MRRILSVTASVVLAASLMGAFPPCAFHNKHTSLSLLTSAAGEVIAPDSTTWDPYDRDPNHVWNRLYRALYQRVSPDGKEHGYDELDPLLWAGTKDLLVDPGYRQ